MTELYRIKPLEWKVPEPPSDSMEIASTPFGIYEVYHHSNGNHIADFSYGGGGYIRRIVGTKGASMEDAKEACEKHWNENMLKALRR